MKHFLKQHFQQALVAFTLLFFVVVVGYFIWGITTISLAVNQVVSARATGGALVQFDIKDAQNLDLKGLLQQ